MSFRNIFKYYLAILILSVLLLSPAYSCSQSIKKFTRNIEDYLSELSTILLNTNNKTYYKKGQVLIDNFSAYLLSGYFDKQTREKIYEISDIMLTKRMRAYPHFYEYINCLTFLGEKRLNKESLNAWFIHLKDLSEDTRSKRLASFISYTLTFLQEKAFFKKGNRSWHYRKGKFDFIYDTAFIIRFKKLDLICTTGKDSTEIQNTSGILNPERMFWMGEGGRIFWKRVRLDEKEVYADLRDYKIKINLVRFSADTVEFYNKKYFPEPMLGSLEEVVLSSYASGKSSYPRFNSFFKNYFIANMFENIDVEGGFSMEGAKLICNAYKDQYVRIQVKIDENNLACLDSKTFMIFNNKMQSDRTIFTLYHESDSIYHPCLKMKYDLVNKKLEFFQVNPGNIIIPFYDSYHTIDIYSETLNWDFDENKISFKALRGMENESQVWFESGNYFSEYDYYKLQGIDIINPLNVISDFSEEYKTKEIKIAVLSQYIRKPEEQVISMVLTLEGMGFLLYEPDEKIAYIKNKLNDYLDAKAGLIDHDVIRFISISKFQDNAVLDLSTFEMAITGVQEIALSAPQKVFIYPVNKKITLLKNRDFEFTGRARAGLFEFYSKECFFEYDTFKISLPDIDSICFYIISDSVDENDNPLLVKVKSVIEDLCGHILIDKPYNKSGLESYPKYPVFNSGSNAYVYYDDKFIRDGVYKREDFYYELDPFTIDSLDDFTTDGIQFSGYLASADIFPMIDQTLIVMPDHSLGFTNQSPEEGYPLYEKKAYYFNKIVLNTEGLTGEGKLEYMNSSSISNNFVFCPDSLVAIADEFTLAEAAGEVEYPSIIGKIIDEKFIPESDVLVLKNTSTPFSLFMNNSKFDGTLFLRPGIVDGEGNFYFEKSSVTSDDFHLKHHSIYADTSDFKLYTDTLFSELAFRADRYSSKMDFEDRLGTFHSNGINSLLEFPFNQYVCTMDELEWDMDENEMELTNHLAQRIPNLNEMSMEELIDIQLTGSEFISTHPEQDSLRFFSLKARYDIDNNIIYAEDVKIIKVADAAIFPKDGLVTIFENAQMETLISTNIISDTTNKYHLFQNSNVNIYSRNSYLAKGFYNYRDYSGMNQWIKCSPISVNEEGQTYALANISDSARFMLSPQYYFYGNVTLLATEKYLTFDGGYQIIQDCYRGGDYWVKFDTLINPDSIVFPVPDKLVDVNEIKLDVSLNYSSARQGFYPAFFENKWNSPDVEIINSDGYLSYDRNISTFIVSKDTVDPGSLEAKQYLCLDERNCTLKGKGKVNLAPGMPYVNLESYGKSDYYIIPDSSRYELIMGIDFYLDAKMVEIITESLQLANLKGVNTNNPLYIDALYHFIGKEEADKMINDILLYGGSKKIPQGLRFAFFLSEVNMIWNSQTDSYISKGDIGIANIYDEHVNKYVNGYLEIEKRETGDAMNLYIEISKSNWYFFNYRNYILQTISSNEDYNDLILDLKPDQRIVKDKKEDEQYEFVISSKRKRIDFLRKIENVFSY